MSDVTGWLIKSALGKIADDMLAQEQFHIRVRAETGEVWVRIGFCDHGWDDMDSFLTDPRVPIPPYGRVWVHVE